MPPAIDYRQTFLRHHVPTELDPRAELQGGGFREEILALDSLRHRLRQAFPDAAAEIHRLASRRRFFLTMPDEGPWLYLPVRVRPLPAGDRGIPRDERDEYNDLTDLLCSTAKTRRSVLLTARSGAGKSTAMLKAFFDCFVGPDPLLGGHLPCYLRAFGKARMDKSAGHEVILDLLAEASRLQLQPSRTQVEAWLTWSPPLVLFLDLNTADKDLRSVLSEAIIRFQERFEGRHRWVIAYRSADRDTTLNYLQQTALFGTYDLLHLEYTDALKYLDSLRRVEDELTNELAPRYSRALSRPAAPASIDSAELRRLFDRYGNDPDSLISTPLLMHFVSVIGIERAAAAESLAQLYAEVVEDYLDRDYGQLGRATTPYAEAVRRSGLMDAEGRTRIKVAMARVALAILTVGDTRLQPSDDTTAEELLDDLLGNPEESREPDWWPTDSWWHEGSYYDSRFKRSARRALREFSFLRRDGDTFGFLHDSFLYYFAALTVRCRQNPQFGRSKLKPEAVRSEWCRKAVERMHQAPGMWRQPSLFLGGMLTPEELNALLPPLLTAEPAAGWFGVVSQLVRGRRRPVGQDDVVLGQVERALGSRAAEVERYPEALFPHIYNHLSWCEEHPVGCEDPQTPCHTFAYRILRPTMNATGRPWLRTETPMPPLREQVFRCDSSVCCMAVLGPGQLVTGHEDGTIRRLRIDEGLWEVLYSHQEGATRLAVDRRDGAILSVGEDLKVRRLAPGEPIARELYQLGERAFDLAVNARDGTIFLGERDGAVRSLAPDGRASEVLYRHEGTAAAVAVDSETGTVISGGDDKWVRVVALIGPCERQALYRHERMVNAVAVDSRDGAILSGGDEGKVYRFARGESTARLVDEHVRPIVKIAADVQAAGIFFGDSEGAICRIGADDQEAQVLYWHERWITALAVDPWSAAVMSAGQDKTVRRFLHPRGDKESLYSNRDDVRCVAIDVRTGAVVSGGFNGHVRRWRPDDGKITTMYEHGRETLPDREADGQVYSVAVDGRDGAVISGGGDYMVERLGPGMICPETLYRHNRHVLSVAVDGRDGSVVSGGLDGLVQRWQSGTDLWRSDGDVRWQAIEEGEVLSRQAAGVFSVAVSERDGSVHWGGLDGKVRRLPRAADVAVVLYEHEGPVLAVALKGKDGTLVSAGSDGTIRLLRSGAVDPEILYRHADSVNSLAVDPLADRLISGGGDANLRVFGLNARDFLMLLTPYSIRSIACSLKHNRIALALGDGRLVLVCIEPSVEALLSYPGPQKNRPPDASTQ